MKRNTLVSYSSSEDEQSDSKEFSEVLEPPAKKRKLPQISSSFTISGPIDNPAEHQGRVRTTPHVDGQWTAHVYICLTLNQFSALDVLIDEVYAFGKTCVPTLENVRNNGKRQLHISLSRSIFLRAHQRDEMKRAVKALAQKHALFMVSFASFAELVNDEKTRTFLTIEIGAGHLELKAITEDLVPALRNFRQQAYYSEPRFHASIAWALLDGAKKNMPLDTSKEQEFPTISKFPEQLIPELNEKYCKDLCAKKNTFLAERVCIKIGPDVSSWKLTG